MLWLYVNSESSVSRAAVASACARLIVSVKGLNTFLGAGEDGGSGSVIWGLSFSDIRESNDSRGLATIVEVAREDDDVLENVCRVQSHVYVLNWRGSDLS